MYSLPGSTIKSSFSPNPSPSGELLSSFFDAAKDTKATLRASRGRLTDDVYISVAREKKLPGEMRITCAMRRLPLFWLADNSGNSLTFSANHCEINRILAFKSLDSLTLMLSSLQPIHDHNKNYYTVN